MKVSNSFPKWLSQFTFPPAVYKYLLIQIFTDIWQCQTCIFVHLVVINSYLIEVLICLSAITKEVEHFFMCVFSICDSYP